MWYVLSDLKTFPTHRNKHSGGLDGPTNLLPTQDCSLLNKLAAGVDIEGFTRVAIFVFGGVS